MQQQSSTRRLALAAVFTALTAVGAFIRIPLPPVPFTLQIMFAIWSGLLLGPRFGLASQAAYIILGLAGLPVFAAGGGVGYVLNPTFGYLIGFAAGAAVAGVLGQPSDRRPASFGRLFAAAIAGLTVAYAVGVPYMYVILNRVSGVSLTLGDAAVTGCLVFLPWDMVKMALAAWLALEIRRRFPDISR